MGDIETERVVEWLQHDVGGRVLRCERQARWRPAYFVDLERGDDVIALYVRGDRVDSPSAFPLEHEYLYQSMLADRGIPVAAVRGWCDEPKAYVMDLLPGRFDFEGVPDAERQAVMEDYIDILVRLHQLDVAPFGAAGVVRAESPARASVIGLEHFEQRAYRALKQRPDPFLEFALAWCKRNRPDSNGRESAIVWDAGQFLHDRGRVTALLDLEFGHIGDPMMDLGGMWTRNAFIPFGDMPSLMRRYEQRSGTTVDIGAVQYHSILWHLSNPLEFHATLAEPVAGSDYMLNRSWVIESNLIALEGIAASLGAPLGDVDEPTLIESGSGPAHQHLTRMLEEITPDAGFGRYQMRIAVRLSRHLDRLDEAGPAVLAADLDDLYRLLGVRAGSWAEAEVQLEAFVIADEGRHDAELIELFHRRLHRARMLNGPAGSWITEHRRAPQPSM
jgi:aminoglycoside phosphotransferase (APT) family kinase protein